MAVVEVQAGAPAWDIFWRSTASPASMAAGSSHDSPVTPRPVRRSNRVRMAQKPDWAKRPDEQFLFQVAERLLHGRRRHGEPGQHQGAPRRRRLGDHLGDLLELLDLHGGAAAHHGGLPPLEHARRRWRRGRPPTSQSERMVAVLALRSMPAATPRNPSWARRTTTVASHRKRTSSIRSLPVNVSSRACTRPTRTPGSSSPPSPSLARTLHRRCSQPKRRGCMDTRSSTDRGVDAPTLRVSSRRAS